MSYRSVHRPVRSVLLIQGLGVLLAVLVSVLGVLAVFPEAHDWVHGNEGGEADHVCAVTLFAQGLEVAAGFAEILVLVGGFGSVVFSASVIYVAAPEYAHPPGCGPPGAGQA